MGVFSLSIWVSTVDGIHSRQITATVDTASSYSVVPASMLMELGIQPRRKEAFELGDGQTIELDVGEARVTVNGKDAVSPVGFGMEGTAALLGAVTLQTLNLVVDAKNERLVSGTLPWY